MERLIKIDAIGEHCPFPVVKAKSALTNLEVGGTLEILVDNEMAVQNLRKMANNLKLEFSSEQKKEKEFLVILGAQNVIIEKKENTSTEVERQKIVVAIDSTTMGNGDETLGKMLLKGYIYALSKQDNLPKYMVFYNSGVTLTTTGSESLEDLKQMQEDGVEILSCGLCLDYYGIKENLEVGTITNMYEIVQIMMENSVVRP